MIDFIYRVVCSDDEVYWVDNANTILESFGTVEEVTRYMLVDPEDITDSVNGDYLYPDESA
jgi:hypothetical protein